MSQSIHKSMDTQDEQIDVSAIIHRIIHKKVTYAVVLGITFVLSCCIILPIPRYYNSTVNLAPEIGDINSATTGISDIASSLGFNLSNNILSDAIVPEFYPQLMKSNNFIIHLTDIKVKTIDGKINTDYYTYLLKYQKYSPYAKALGAIKSLFKKEKQSSSQTHKLDPFKLTKQENDIFGAIRSKIKCSVDKKTNLITISVEDQDPLVAATMANQASEQLKNFISSYRTSKSRKDVEYYQKLTDEAKCEYEKARKLYGSYSDANTDLIQESYRLKVEDLENDMQLKFNTYSSLNNQLQAAKAKVQEKTPVFTSITSASVPLRPAGPKRMIFVLGMLFVAFIVTTIYISRDLIF